MTHGGDSPDEDREGVSGFGAELIDDAAGEDETEAVGELEDDDDVAEVVIEGRLMELVSVKIPTHEGDVVKEWLDECEDRAVHVIDGGCEKEEKANKPSDIGFVRNCAGKARVGQACSVRHERGAPAAMLVGPLLD